MDLRKIKKLIDLLEESNLAEIEIKEGEESVRLARVPKGGLVQAAAPMVQHVAAPAAAPAPAPVMPMHSPSEAATGGSHKPHADLPPGHVVRAPMVGVLSALPVEVGAQVQPGTNIARVAVAMKSTPSAFDTSGKLRDARRLHSMTLTSASRAKSWRRCSTQASM